MSLSKTALALTSLLSAKFEIILRSTLPFASCSIIGATASAMVLTAFAPIASPVLTISSAITIGPLMLETTLTLRSFAPPPRETSRGSCSFAMAKIASFRLRSCNLAPFGSEGETTWICPTIIGPVLVTLKPPLTLAIFAALLAAATTEGSSRAIGMR